MAPRNAEDSHPVRAAVRHRIPAYRVGLMATLRRAGFAVDEPGSVSEWAVEPGRRLLVAELPDEGAVDSEAELVESNDELVVVGLVEGGDASLQSRAIARGLFVAEEDEEPTQLIEVVRAAAAGRVRVRKETALSWMGPATQGRQVVLSNEERTLLQQLAAGRSVEEIAADVGLSRRVLHRRLRRLYAVLGAANRSEAVFRAGLLGVIPPPADR